MYSALSRSFPFLPNAPLSPPSPMVFCTPQPHPPEGAASQASTPAALLPPSPWPAARLQPVLSPPSPSLPPSTRSFSLPSFQYQQSESGVSRSMASSPFDPPDYSSSSSASPSSFSLLSDSEYSSSPFLLQQQQQTEVEIQIEQEQEQQQEHEHPLSTASQPPLTGSFPMLRSSTTSFANLRQRVTTPTAKLGNEFADAETAAALQELFEQDLFAAEPLARLRSEFRSGSSFGVWARAAWRLLKLVRNEQLLTVGRDRSLPFTTIATALDIFRRSIRAQRRLSEQMRKQTSWTFLEESTTDEEEFGDDDDDNNNNNEEEVEEEAARKDAEFAAIEIEKYEHRVWLYASFLVATKIEETLVTFKSLAEVVSAKSGVDIIRAVLLKEQRILAILGFDIVLQIPHRKLLKMADQSIYLQIPNYIKELALSFLNISIITSVMTAFHPISIAVTALYHAVHSCLPYLPADDPLVCRDWWSEFQVPADDLLEISQQLVPAVNAILVPPVPLQIPSQFSPFSSSSSPPSPSLASTTASSSTTSISTTSPSPSTSTSASPPVSPSTSMSTISSSSTSNSPSQQEPRMRRPLYSCRSIIEFRKLAVINKGTFGTVYKAEEVCTGKRAALKRLHSTWPSNNGYGGFPYYMLRELLYLIRLNHPHIIHGSAMAVKDLILGSKPPKFYIVMEYIEWDLFRLLETQKDRELDSSESLRFTLAQVKSLLQQLLEAIAYMHSMNLLHRDLKCANLLLTHSGSLKVADLGSIRDADRGCINMTNQVITLWYRPPELLCEVTTYSSAVDIWSIGCLFYEFLTYHPLFGGDNEAETLQLIIKTKGAPDPEVWERIYANLERVKDFDNEFGLLSKLEQYPHPRPLAAKVPMLTREGADLFSRMLEWDPAKRISAKEALRHPFFQQKPEPVPPVIHPSLLSAV